jgi:hypothetical protein
MPAEPPKEHRFGGFFLPSRQNGFSLLAAFRFLVEQRYATTGKIGIRPVFHCRDLLAVSSRPDLDRFRL